jgi:hypothetical protein
MIPLLGWAYNGGVLGKYMIIFGFCRFCGLECGDKIPHRGFQKPAAAKELFTGGFLLIKKAGRPFAEQETRLNGIK